MNNDKKTIIIVLIVILIVIVASIFGCKYYADHHVDKNNQNSKNNKVIDAKDVDFNTSIIKKVNDKTKGNYLISPYSMEIALNMLKDGASGETYNQIEKLVGTRKIPTFMSKERINVVNGAFIKNKYKEAFEESYYDKLKEYKADLIFDEYTTPNPINEWVSKQTYGMIPKLLESISDEFAFGIANAVAIDVEWDNGFKCENTHSQEFTKEDNTKFNTEMMSDTYYSGVEYFMLDDAKGVILPYREYDAEGKVIYDFEENKNVEGTRLEFVGILPNKTVSEYINNLTRDKLKEIDEKKVKIEDKKNTVLWLRLPRFSYDFDLEPFKDILKEMGMVDAFNANAADFSKIVSKETLKKMNVDNIYVNQAIHKTHVDVNEKGTKAAAVTYFGFNETSSIGDEPEPEEIIITFDKPFIYMIRDSKTKEMLFFGVVREPNVWKGSTCSNREEE